MRIIQFGILFLFLTNVSFGQSTKVQHEGNSQLDHLEAQKSSLNEINDDYRNGKKLISEYYDLVNQAIEEDRPELFDEAIAKAKQAKTLLGHAYSREKALRANYDTEINYSPLTLAEYKKWVSLAEGLITGNHIKDVQAIYKAQTIQEANTSVAKSKYYQGDFWVDGYAEQCGHYYDMKDCGANPVCLKIKFCRISETTTTVTVTAEIQPKLLDICFGSSNNDPIKIIYDGNEVIIPRSEFKLNGFKTNEFTIKKSIPFGDGYIKWNKEDLMFELDNDYPTNGTKTTAGVVINVDC